MNSYITRDEIRSVIEDKLCAIFSVTSETATNDQIFEASAIVIRELMSRFLAVKNPSDHQKEVHYMSMEFLLGRSLMKNAFNLGVSEALTGALKDMGRDPADIFEAEPDAGLGNGGLGRLAACYLESMTTLGLTGTGYSICYELGIFRQLFRDGKQTEVADNWRTAMESWLIPRYEDAVEVRFEGRVEPHWDNFGHYTAEYTGYTAVTAVPRDMLIAGYGCNDINTLRLWDAHSVDSLDMYLFSEGKYVASMENRTMAEVITKILYPADDHIEGKTLRLKQQYFFVSASAQDIVRKHVARWGDIRSFAEHHVIQINDTHPTLIIPELMRIFMDEYFLGWDEAWRIVCASVAYTNHTVMSEALERWPQDLMARLLPRIWEIMCEINRRWCDYLVSQLGAGEKTGRNLIIRDGQVHMANMCLAACFKVNGVSRLHGDIIKNDLFRDVASFRRERFTYVTNGIDHRRWLGQINPGLHSLLCELLGSDAYLTDSSQLARLVQYVDDETVRQKMLAIKAENKKRFAAFAQRNDHVTLNTDAIMDVQIKRLHEYKRQLLCAMHIAKLQLQLHADPNRPFVPRTYVFGAKAAPGYQMAKKLIRFLYFLSRELDDESDKISLDDPCILIHFNGQAAGSIPVFGRQDTYAVFKFRRYTDKIFCEVHTVVEERNIYIFGLNTYEVDELWRHGYIAREFYHSSESLHRTIDRLWYPIGGQDFSHIADYLINGGYTVADPFMCLADFDSYCVTAERALNDYRNKRDWNRKSLINVARSGRFSSDVSIRHYANEIWHIDPVGGESLV